MKTSIVLTTLTLLFAGPARLLPQTAPTPHEADFDELWSHLAGSYAYFDKKAIDWDCVRELYRPQAALVSSRAELIHLLENVIEELYDHHAALGTNTPRSYRLVPTDTDLWAGWHNGRALVQDVRANSDAARQGLRAGLEISAINGIAIREAVRRRLPRALVRYDPAAEDWALRVVLAGRHEEPRTLTIVDDGRTRTVSLAAPALSAERGVLDSRRIGDIAYLKPLNSLGRHELVVEIDRVLADMRDARGLVLDLRDTPSGGNTTVARAILGRFIEREAPYQLHSIPAEERRWGVKRSWLEIVSPRGDFQYTSPMVVLVGRWTGSMGEGIAIALDGLRRAAVVGTRMAGLAGATYTFRLPHSGITVNAPAEKLFHVNGTPREDFVPVAADPARTGDRDSALATALAMLDPHRPQ